GKTVTITSTGGAILDSKSATDTGDDTDVTADKLALSAATGIGTSTDNIITNVNTLAAKTTSGGIFLKNAGALTIGTVTTVTGIPTNGGDVNVTAGAVTSGTQLTVSKAIDTTTGANVTLTADRMSLGAAVNAHAGIVSLVPTTFGRNIDVGTN